MVPHFYEGRTDQVVVLVEGLEIRLRQERLMDWQSSGQSIDVSSLSVASNHVEPELEMVEERYLDRVAGSRKHGVLEIDDADRGRWALAIDELRPNDFWVSYGSASKYTYATHRTGLPSFASVQKHPVEYTIINFTDVLEDFAEQLS